MAYSHDDHHPAHSAIISIISKSTVFPLTKSSIPPLRLSASDLPMLTCQYIQKGCLYSSSPQFNVSSLQRAFSKALSLFPPLAGRFSTDPITSQVSIISSDAGASFIHASATSISISDIADAHLSSDTTLTFQRFFAFDDTLSYDGHSLPLVVVQVTHLADGVFIGCTINHAIVDGTSFWHFFNTFADISCGIPLTRPPPCFSRHNPFSTDASLRFPHGRPGATFSSKDPIRERIFRFSREAVTALKKRANEEGSGGTEEIIGKANNDNWKSGPQISSFQSVCALLWRSVTRARNLPSSKTTTFRMAVNCRGRVETKMDPLYFGNAIQSIPTAASAEEVVKKPLGWSAGLLCGSVREHDDRRVRMGVEEWEREPRCFPLGNFDGGMVTMGSSPRFPMYDNDFGWGKPVAVRSGKANKFDGKISAFPSRDGDGSLELEVVLAPETMAGLLMDQEFMQYVG